MERKMKEQMKMKSRMVVNPHSPSILPTTTEKEKISNNAEPKHSLNSLP